MLYKAKHDPEQNQVNSLEYLEASARWIFAFSCNKIMQESNQDFISLGLVPRQLFSSGDEVQPWGKARGLSLLC